MADLSSTPLVSIGLPLYRSKRFLDTVVGNIDALTYPNLEVIASDRHLHDDALETIRRRYGGNPRFRFLEGTDQLTWVENFNLLLREARGKYAVLMFHDDTYPSNYVTELVNALEREPEASLAFGRVEQLSLDGFLPTLPFTPPPVPAGAAWTIRDSLRALTIWQLWFAFRGMVRLDVVRGSGLYIRPTYCNIRADIYWVFALSLRGHLLYVPSCSCVKRFHRSSAAADWKFDLRQSLDACRVLRSYCRTFARSRRDSMIGQLILYPWCLVQALLPRGAAKRLVKWHTAFRTPR
jgi:GT2 family glycosyltransferase